MGQVNYYNLLGVRNDSTEDEICEAIIKNMENFDEEYSMLDDESSLLLLETMFEGIRVLLNPDARNNYDITFDFRASNSEMSDLYNEMFTDSIFANKDDSSCDYVDFGPFSYVKKKIKNK